MRVLLVDDEKMALEELEYYLKKENCIEVVGVFTNPVEAINKAESLPFDAAFLDIDMPVINGFNVARELMEINDEAGIVFVTAFNEYAVKAFEINAVDYLLKPIDKERLGQAVKKLAKSTRIEKGETKAFKERLSLIEKCIRQDAAKFASYNEDETIFVKMSEVIYIEAMKGKTSIITRHGSYKAKETLDTLEAKLMNYGFYRCHRSYIINLRHVKKLSPMFNSNYIIQQDGCNVNIPVSRNTIRELKTILGVG